MDKICRVSGEPYLVSLSYIDENGDESAVIEGWIVDVFVPLDKRADVDRNDDKRKEMAEIIDAAITAVEG